MFLINIQTEDSANILFGAPMSSVWTEMNAENPASLSLIRQREPRNSLVIGKNQADFDF